jgi:hypothetical protein
MSRRNMSERFTGGLMLCEITPTRGTFANTLNTPNTPTTSADRINALVKLGYAAEPGNASGRTSIIDNGLQYIKENGFNKDDESTKVTLLKINEQIQDWKTSGKTEAEIKLLLENTLGRYGITAEDQKGILDTLRKQGEQVPQDPFTSATPTPNCVPDPNVDPNAIKEWLLQNTQKVPDTKPDTDPNSKLK